MKPNVFLLSVFLLMLLSSCNLFDFDDRGDLSVSLIAHNITGYIDLEGAKVFTIPASVEGIADNRGNVLMKGIKEGSYKIYATLDGYGSGNETVMVTADSLTKVSITLEQKVFLSMAPQITVISPMESSFITLDDTLTFSLKITDDASAANKIDVQITSDLDGVLFHDNPEKDNTVTFSTSSLSKGFHTIYVRATDSDNYTNAVKFYVSTTAPGEVSIDTAYIQDGGVKIDWVKYYPDDFLKYEVYYTLSSDWWNGELIATITDQEITTFTHKLPPMAVSCNYFVRAYNTSNEYRDTRFIKVDYPGGKIYYHQPKDAIIHPTEPIVYIVDVAYNDLIAINYETSEEIAKAKLPGTIGDIAIGDNGYGLEVYTSSSDGNLYAYNAATLKLNSTIAIGPKVESVATNGNGYLIVSLNTESFQWDKTIRVISRKDGSLLSYLTDDYGIFAGYSFRFIPNSNNVLGITKYTGPADLDYFELNSSGTAITHYDDSYHDQYQMDPTRFEVSDNGQYLVTSMTGLLFTATPKMTYLGTIGDDWNRFSDFAFSADGSTIYAGAYNSKKIYTIAYPSLVKEEQPIRGYPRFLFRRDNELIIISMVNNELFNFGIEKIKLN
jgi:hypothetical protein